MDDPKLRLTRLERALGNAYSDVNGLRSRNHQLVTENVDLIKELKKSNELLTKAEELINSRKTGDEELDGILDNVEAKTTELQEEINRLKDVNAELLNQMEEIKGQSNSIYIKSLAILGVFASGAWIVVGIGNLISTIRNRTT